MSAAKHDSEAKVCEVWAYNVDTGEYDTPTSLFENPNPNNPVTEGHFPVHGAGIPVLLLTPPNGTSMLSGNCYYDYAFQTKRCVSCSKRGRCEPTTGKCLCYPQYSNFDCSYMACP